MAGSMVCRCVVQIQVCICWFFVQGCVQVSTTVYFDSSVQKIDAFSTSFMCKLNLTMDVVNVFNKPIQFFLTMVPDHKNVINEP